MRRIKWLYNWLLRNNLSCMVSSRLLPRRHTCSVSSRCDTYERVVSHIRIASGHKIACVTSHIWMSPHKSCDTYECTYERVMSHIRMRHVISMNASRPIYKWVLISHVTHMTEHTLTCSMSSRRDTYECVMSLTWIRSETLYEWVMSDEWWVVDSHAACRAGVPHMNVSCHPHE